MMLTLGGSCEEVKGAGDVDGVAAFLEGASLTMARSLFRFRCLCCL
jgi:hypothetical protein